MGQLAFPDSAHVYIDTVTVIYAVEQTPTYGVLLNPLWNNLQAENLEVFTSELTLMETLVVPLRNSDTFYRFGGHRVCDNTQMRTDLLEAAVWQQVCHLLLLKCYNLN
ncbi:MAG: hypothetical protein DSM106950_28985 [Stigonema ocellatum SAG 48.90 = DSM 106950]|nr:hypothetical protein [Stigonema ocellatum SAG 48.90 = DSM 106950]